MDGTTEVKRGRRQCKAADQQRRERRCAEICRPIHQLQEPDRRECADRQLREHRHQDQRPVRVLGDNVRDVDRGRLGRKLRRQRHARRRQTEIACRQSRVWWTRLDRRAPGRNIYDLNRDRTLGAGTHACRRLAERQAAVAHVALPDDAALRVVLRNPI